MKHIIMLDGDKIVVGEIISSDKDLIVKDASVTGVEGTIPQVQIHKGKVMMMWEFQAEVFNAETPS